jgi:transcriptional regulator with XRE-family HTH domain
MTPLRATLKSLGMTQADLAAELGVSQGTVSRWANGSLRLPVYVTAYLVQRERRMLYPGFTDAQITAGLTVPATKEGQT